MLKLLTLIVVLLVLCIGCVDNPFEKFDDVVLSDLIFSKGTLDPVFSPKIKSYKLVLTKNTSSVTVKPTVTNAFDQKPTITVNGKTVASGEISEVSIKDTLQTVIITVTAGDSSNQSCYIVTIHSSISDPVLSNLELSVGTLTPVFNPVVRYYSTLIPESTHTITMIPEVLDSFLRITVNGISVKSGTPSPPLILNDSVTEVTISVTAFNSEPTATYKVHVYKVKETGAYLLNLAVSAGTLTPQFNSTIFNYLNPVDSSLSSISLTPTAIDGNAHIVINGVLVKSGSPSGSIHLNDSTTIITIVVTALNGVAQLKYMVKVRKEIPKPSLLENLSVSTGELSPTFQPSIFSYVDTVSDTVSYFTLTPTVKDTNSRIYVKGIYVKSGTASTPLSLSSPAVTIDIIVKGAIGISESEYTVKVVKRKTSNAHLSKIVISKGTLFPVFQSSVFSYVDTIGLSEKEITITPYAVNPEVTILVNAMPLVSGTTSKPIVLTNSVTNIPIEVTAKDGTTKLFYHINVAKTRSQMVLIVAKGKNYKMGGDFDVEDEKPIHTVTFTYDFWMENVEVIQREYETLMGVNPSQCINPFFPVEKTTWFDAVLFCNAKSKKEKFDTVYAYSSISGTPGNGCNDLKDLSIDIKKNGYRLPTEAEWEFACRAGSSMKFYWGDNVSEAGEFAWSSKNSNSTTHLVAQKKGNPFALYDICGNVYEWCNDWYGNYIKETQIDPVGPLTGEIRVLRGGSWDHENKYLRSANRWAIEANTQNPRAGIRTVRTIK